MLQKFPLWTLVALCAACVFTTACTKDDLDFGYDYLEKSDFMSAFVDSSTQITLSTQLDNTLRSQYILYMAGKATTPVAETQASFMNRFYFKDLSSDLANKDRQLESIMLELIPLTQFVGDTTAEQTFEIRELTQFITNDVVTNYFTKSILPTDIISSSTVLGEQSFVAYPSDSAKNFQFLFPEERAQKLYNDICSFYTKDSSQFYNDSLLNNAFKGLYVKPLAGSAVMNYNVHVVITTTINGTTEKTRLLPSLDAYNDVSITDESRRNLYVQALSIFEHTFTSEIQSQIGKSGNVAYVAGLLGLKTRLQLENFNHWKDSLVVFNSTHLQMNIEQMNAANEVEVNNQRLRLYIYNADNDLVAGSPIIPSTADSVLYDFNISNFMMILQNNSAAASDYTFEIGIPDNNRYGNVFKIDALANEMKLILKYSR